jgi:hypothetical protein
MAHFAELFGRKDFTGESDGLIDKVPLMEDFVDIFTKAYVLCEYNLQSSEMMPLLDILAHSVLFKDNADDIEIVKQISILTGGRANYLRAMWMRKCLHDDFIEACAILKDRQFDLFDIFMFWYMFWYTHITIDDYVSRVKTLIHVMDPDYIDPKEGSILSEIVCNLTQGINFGILEYALSRKFNLNFNTTDGNPLFSLCCYGTPNDDSIKAAKMLLAAGANANLRIKCGGKNITALESAQERNWTQMVELIQDHMKLQNQKLSQEVKTEVRAAAERLVAIFEATISKLELSVN